MAEPYSAPVRNTFDGSWTAAPLTVTICSALAGSNALECLILILSTFKSYRGLYFWSLIAATVGILVYMPGIILWYFVLVPKWAALICTNLGWYNMVTGQSAVLYSRLGVVMGLAHETLRRAVKWVIVVDAVVFHGLTTVVSVCSIYSGAATRRGVFAEAYFYVERIQMTAFSLQELMLSGLYIWKTLGILRAGSGVHARARRIMAQLLVINLVIVVMDVALLTLEYMDLFFHELSFKMLSYSVKVKLEFAILSKLVEASQVGVRRSSLTGQDCGGDGDGDDPALQPKAGGCSEEVQMVEEDSTRHRYAFPSSPSASNRKDSELDYAEILKSMSK